MNDTPQTLEKDVRDNLLLLYDFDKDYDVKLLKYSENVIFKITFKEAFPVVLRIHTTFLNSLPAVVAINWNTFFRTSFRKTGQRLPVALSPITAKLLPNCFRRTSPASGRTGRTNMVHVPVTRHTVLPVI